MAKPAKKPSKPAKKAPLKDLKVKKAVKGGCGCMGMGQDPGRGMTIERAQPANLLSATSLTKAPTIIR